MTDMTLKHTVSPSGKTHRLTDPKTGQSVQLAYTTKPRFFDQVQGDLIRKFSREIFPVVIGQLPWRTDPAILDRGQREPSLEYLRGYLAGLEIATETARADHEALVKSTREQIARLEALQRPLSVTQDRSLADDEPRFPRGPQNGAGAASVQIDQVQQPRVSRLDEGVRRVRDAERNGW